MCEKKGPLAVPQATLASAGAKEADLRKGGAGGNGKHRVAAMLAIAPCRFRYSSENSHISKDECSMPTSAWDTPQRPPLCCPETPG